MQIEENVENTEETKLNLDSSISGAPSLAIPPQAKPPMLMQF